MRLSIISNSLLPGLAFALVTTAFAASKPNKGSFEVFDSVTVSGHQLVRGQYKLTWDGTGPDVEAMILSRGKLVATVPAHLTDLDQAQRADATVLRKNDDGSVSLTQVDFRGKKYALSFGNDSAATDSISETGNQ
ncbi:MAG: hypothetical protein ACLP00_20235 [Terracidiphilus sp.]